MHICWCCRSVAKRVHVITPKDIENVAAHGSFLSLQVKFIVSGFQVCLVSFKFNFIFAPPP